MRLPLRRLRLQPDLGEEVPADAVALRQGQRVRIADAEHAPQPLLELARSRPEWQEGHRRLQVAARAAR